jgi:hypothetical protein
MSNTLHTANIAEMRTPSLVELSRSCERLATAEPGDTRELARLLSKMNLRYYSDVLFFVIAAIYFGMQAQGMKAWVSVAAGALVQVISGTCFYLYGKASDQFATFHVCLDRSNRFVLANTLCEKLERPIKDDTRAYLVHVIAEAELLTSDVVSGNRRAQKLRPDQKSQHLPFKQRGDQPQSISA